MGNARHVNPKKCFGVTGIVGGPVIEQSRSDGLPVASFITTNASKTAAIEALALAFERGTITIPNDPALLGELQAFEAKSLPSGMTRYAAPEGLHAHCVMSLATNLVKAETESISGPEQ